MTIAIIIVALALAHIACDVAGVPFGKQVRWLLKPAVWLIYALTFGCYEYCSCYCGQCYCHCCYCG